MHRRAPEPSLRAPLPRGALALELVWDRLAYPIGAPETRIEVEALTPASEALFERVDADLRDAFGPDLKVVAHGKCKELCTRLYPQLVG